MRRLLLLTALFSMLYVSSAHAMVTMSKHNLSSTQPVGTNIFTSATTEVCVFCHTPHGGTYRCTTMEQGNGNSGYLYAIHKLNP